MAKRKKSKSPKVKIGSNSYIFISLLLIVAICAAVYFSMHYGRRVAPKAKIKTDVAQETTVKVVAPNTQKSVQPKSAEPKGDKKISAPKSELPKTSKTKSLEIPLYYDSTYIIKNDIGRYTLLYSNLHKQALWVAYILTRKDVETKSTERQTRFTIDPMVAVMDWQTATDADYKRSSYDRGHLLPSADRDNSKQENIATFVYSNVSPQRPNLNRGVWAELEKQIRRWANKYDSLYIVAGGVLESGSNQPIKTIGANKVSVPNYFYKVAMAKINGGYHAVGFVFPNSNDVSDDFQQYAMTVNEVEEFTGYDFFDALDDVIEGEMEREVDRKIWR